MLGDGDALNSAGVQLGANTDGFDVSTDGPLTIENSKNHGQDDCLAINRGNDITFTVRFPCDY